MTTPPPSRAAAANTADRATSDPAPLVPTPTTADPPATGPDHVTAREITEFLRDLAELRAGARGPTSCDDLASGPRSRPARPSCSPGSPPSNPHRL